MPLTSSPHATTPGSVAKCGVSELTRLAGTSRATLYRRLAEHARAGRAAQVSRGRWRAAASVTTGDGGAWLEGDAARKIAYDAMIIPVVTGDIDPGAVEELIALCGV